MLAIGSDLEEQMKLAIQDEQMGRKNSRCISSMRFLFLALNDAVAFEREVLETGKNSSQELQLRANSTTQELCES